MGGGVELLQGTSTPGVAELPQGYETTGVTTTGEGVPGEDGRGQGGGGNPPTTRATEVQGACGGSKQEDGQAQDVGAAAPTEGHGGRQQQRGDPDQVYLCH